VYQYIMGFYAHFQCDIRVLNLNNITNSENWINKKEKHINNNKQTNKS